MDKRLIFLCRITFVYTNLWTNIANADQHRVTILSSLDVEFRYKDIVATAIIETDKELTVEEIREKISEKFSN